MRRKCCAIRHQNNDNTKWKLVILCHLMPCIVSIKYMHIINNFYQIRKLNVWQWSFLVILFFRHDFAKNHQSSVHLNNLALSMCDAFFRRLILLGFFLQTFEADHQNQRHSHFIFSFPVHRHFVPISSSLLMILLFSWCITPLPFHDIEL